MYPNYNMYPNYQSMQRNNRNFFGNTRPHSDDRFFGGGIIAPLLIGGIAGYALGRPNNCWGPNCFYPTPYYPYPNYYYNNFYY